MSLNELRHVKMGRFRILRLEGARELTDRLEEMGFFPGADVEISGRLPFGGPWLVRRGAGHFALRAEEAAAIILGDAA